MTADIIIPVGPYHSELAKEAVNSARAQTIPCNVIRIDDTEGRGAAWARNTGALRGRSPFIVFLDADDILHPHFVEHTLQSYSERKYVYTDWRTYDDRVRFAVDTTNFFKVGMYHIITTLLPRAAFEAVGGFNEHLAALEDEDLYYRLQVAGICGVRCAEPLVWYRRQHGRGLVNSVYHGENKRNRAVAQMDVYFTEHYGKYRRLTNMCSCQDKKAPPQVINQQEDGLVLARALYSPRRAVGPVSGRKYPRTGLGHEVWIDPRDAEGHEDLWEIIPQIETPSVDDVRDMALRALNG
jgi:hypothetical protein